MTVEGFLGDRVVNSVGGRSQFCDVHVSEMAAICIMYNSIIFEDLPDIFDESSLLLPQNHNHITPAKAKKFSLPPALFLQRWFWLIDQEIQARLQFQVRLKRTAEFYGHDARLLRLSELRRAITGWLDGKFQTVLEHIRTLQDDDSRQRSRVSSRSRSYSPRPSCSRSRSRSKLCFNTSERYGDSRSRVSHSKSRR